MVLSSKGEEKYKMTLDSILNVLIPAGIFIFLGTIIYSKAKKPIDAFFAMVKGWFQQPDKDESSSHTERYSENNVWSHKINYQGADY